jgi:hypothetical protein
LKGQTVFLAERCAELMHDDLITDRTIIDVIAFTKSAKSINVLDKDEFDHTIEVYNELFIKAEPNEFLFGFHGMLDNVVIDHNSKTIFINDLKTLGKSIQDFPDSVEYYKYWIQAVIYVILAKKEFAIDKDWNVQVTFIVIDKYNQVYPYQVSTATLAKWELDFEEIVKTIKWHYENKRYDCSYEIKYNKQPTLF